jgi:hypothetical protein
MSSHDGHCSYITVIIRRQIMNDWIYHFRLRTFLFPPWRNGPQWAKGLLIIETWRSYSDTPSSVGILWTSDQPVADLYLTTHNTHNRQTSVTPEGFKPTIPTSERPQNHALDRAATGIGFFCVSSPLCCTEETYGSSTTLKRNQIREIGFGGGISAE